MQTHAISASYLYSKSVDVFFVVGIPLVALISMSVVLWKPELFGLMFLLDLNLLGYHHVISTFTRFQLNQENSRLNKWLLLYAPPFILSALFGLADFGGAALIVTAYLHWQWWHYTRQSEGMAKIYTIKTQSKAAGNPLENRITFYLIPVATFLAMSAREPHEFLFNPVYVLPMPSQAADFLLALAAVLFIKWFIQQTRAVIRKQMAPLLYLYYLSHHIVYVLAYYLVEDINIGWLMINIWHNLQYIIFVWICNVKQHGRESAGLAAFKSWICKPSNWFIYFSSCFLLTYLIYGGVETTVSWLSHSSTLPIAVIIYQSINFHHYVVDTFIWKIRKPSVQLAVGI